MTNYDVVTHDFRCSVWGDRWQGCMSAAHLCETARTTLTNARPTLQSARLCNTDEVVQHDDTPGTMFYRTTRPLCWIKWNYLKLIIDARSLVIKLDILLFVELFGEFRHVLQIEHHPMFRTGNCMYYIINLRPIVDRVYSCEWYRTATAYPTKFAHRSSRCPSYGRSVRLLLSWAPFINCIIVSLRPLLPEAALDIFPKTAPTKAKYLFFTMRGFVFTYLSRCTLEETNALYKAYTLTGLTYSFSCL